jgi:hypothetical protein
MHLKYMGRKDAQWIHLAQHREKWQTLVTVVMNLKLQAMLG